MLRAIIAVIVGYVVMFIWVVATLTAAWFALGSDFAFNEGTYEASTGWSVVMLVLGLVGAVIAGCVTASIGRAAAPVKVLAGIVLVLGLAEAAVHQLRPEEPETEPAAPVEELAVWEAAGKSQPPAWYSFTIPVVGCAGVLIGGRRRRGGRSSTRATGEVGPD